MSTRLDNTLGAFFVGTVVAAVLYGISCVQALVCYVDQNDPWYVKLMVTAVMIFDTVHQASISQTVYTYTITDWGDSARLGVIVWSLSVEAIFTGVTAFIVQSFLTMRIWRLSGRNVYITGITMMLVIGAFGTPSLSLVLLMCGSYDTHLSCPTVTLIIDFAMMTQLIYLPELGKLKGLSTSVSALQAAADLLIAATLCTLLNSSRSGLYKSEIIINRLILFTVNTGLLTSFCALSSLITLLAVPNTSLNIAFFFCLGRLYTNTLLASLNTRKRIRDVTSIELQTGDIPISLGDLSTSPSIQHQNVSINIKTSTQKRHDQKLDKENSGLPYDEQSNNVSY